jgi:hypothetical protein
MLIVINVDKGPKMGVGGDPLTLIQDKLVAMG